MLNAINAIRLQDRPISLDGQFIGSLDTVYRASRGRPHSRGYHIRPVRTPYQHGLAGMLVRRMYSGCGYSTESPTHRLDDPNRVTLVAWHADDVVATLTLGRDSTDGLLADALYARELNSLRRPNRIVCEVTRLAVNPDFSHRDLLTNLFQAALQYGKDIFTGSDAVIEVNPRHASYYQRMLGFQKIGNLRQCQRVDAPAVLLHQELDGIAIQTGNPPDSFSNSDSCQFAATG
ncbi:MAG: hypothetical protein JNM42_15630 [Propionivibrio sp.]|uniref:GNAT family N-acetyltransferase n=1 Tax=Propionivibrio sp. TaxID=2212460 RepID=UPI001A511F19|nr:GNAT family N-acetyltransferase [Propionivibrio sp.]MBL8415864.1 hypothetical protein [Propionivibrio sp.]